LFLGITTVNVVEGPIPPHLYKDILDINDLVIVTLEHIDYLLKFRGIKSPYGYSAYSILKNQ
jgi:hypothetical protein